MKKYLISAFLLPLALQAEDLVFSDQTVTVAQENLSFKSLSYVDESTYSETNEVSGDVTITTNEATWVCILEFELPRGYQWSLNNHPVEIRRFSTYITVYVDPEDVVALFGANAAGSLEYVAKNGHFEPEGSIKSGFVSLAAQTLLD